MNFIFLKSLFVGLAISLPIGPVGILCLQRLFTRGPKIGLFSGLGAATADIIYSLIAAASLTLIGPTIHEYEQYFRIVGSIALCILGISIIISEPETPAKRAKKINARQAFFSTLFIVLSNPAIIFMFLAFLSMINISTAPFTAFNALRIALGVFCGSSIWWVSLAFLAHKYTITFDFKTIDRLNKIAGTAIACFGVVGLGIALFKMI